VPRARQAHRGQTRHGTLAGPSGSRRPRGSARGTRTRGHLGPSRTTLPAPETIPAPRRSMSTTAMRIGIDLGGTKIEAVALGESGLEVARLRVRTPREDYAGTVRAIADLV